LIKWPLTSEGISASAGRLTIGNEIQPVTQHLQPAQSVGEHFQVLASQIAKANQRPESTINEGVVNV